MWLRNRSEQSALYDLFTKVDKAKFESTFGSTEQYNALVEVCHELFAFMGIFFSMALCTTACWLCVLFFAQSKTLTISKLLEIAPVGTVDPSPYIYDNTMYAMAGLMSIAAISHIMVKPVDPKYFEKVEPEQKK